jgi:hypothetical protein
MYLHCTFMKAYYISVTTSLWNYYNEIVHGATADETAVNILQSLHIQVTSLYP